MPRQNLHLLLAISLISIVCYRQADSAHRNRVGRMFDTFVEVVNEVHGRYLEEVDDRELFEGALEGMVNRLDPYSDYISPDEFQQFHQGIEQEFPGVGIEVSLDPETKLLTVMSPMIGGPAYQQGVLAGDVILKVDGQSIEGLSLDDAVRRLRGRKGEPVTLTVLHSGETEPVDIRVVRDVIRSPSVLGDTLNADGTWNYFLADHPDIGYIRVTSFGERTAEELAEALDDIAANDPQGLILDLRNNPGGLLVAANAVADLFLREGTIVSIRGRDPADEEVFTASGRARYADLPLVVLVNRHSASASEIVAASLQDHGRAAVVGERTWGKGTVQDVIQLEGGTSALKLTTRSYWRPSNKNIHRRDDAGDDQAWGVVPDDGLAVPLTDQQFVELLRDRRHRDTQVFAGAPRTGNADQSGNAVETGSGEHGESAAASEADAPVVDEALQRAVERLKHP